MLHNAKACLYLIGIKYVFQILLPAKGQCRRKDNRCINTSMEYYILESFRFCKSLVKLWQETNRKVNIKSRDMCPSPNLFFSQPFVRTRAPHFFCYQLFAKSNLKHLYLIYNSQFMFHTLTHNFSYIFCLLSHHLAHSSWLNQI